MSVVPNSSTLDNDRENGGPELEQFIPETRFYTEGPNAKRAQYLLAIFAHLGAFIMATVWSYSSTALPSLREDKDSIGEVSATQEAWIASITFLAGAAGSPVLGQISDYFGLQKSLLIATVPLLLGWLLITFAINLPMILVGRFITGFFVSGVGVSNPLVAEYSKAKRRGRLNFIFDLMFCAGVLYIYIIGTFLNWRWQAGLCGLICVLFFLLLFFYVPESAAHLVRKKQNGGAEKGLMRMRDLNANDVTTELDHIKATTKTEKSKVDRDGWQGHFKIYFTRSTLRPVFLCVALQFFLQVSGVVPIVCYAVDVFRAAGTSQVHENVSTIVFGTINLLATWTAFFVVDKWGRRKLMIFSETFLFLSLLAVGTFLHFKEGQNNEELEKFSWVLLLCFIVYIIAYSFGVGPLPWVIMGEIVAPEVKGVSCGFINFLARIFGFLVMFYFKDMIIIFGQAGVYWFFSAVCFAGGVFTFFMLPETKGTSLEQIQKDLQGGLFYHLKSN